MGVWWRAIIRAAIWLITVVVALYPVSHAAHHGPSPDILKLAIAANEHLLFRDFFFIVVVLVAASFGNILYMVVREGTDAIPVWIKGLSTLTCLYYLYVIVYGVGRFSELAQLNAPIPLDDLKDDLTFMGFALLITLSAELMISLTEGAEPTYRRPIVPRNERKGVK